MHLSVLTSHYALRLTDYTRSSVRKLRMETHGSYDVHHHVEAPALLSHGPMGLLVERPHA